VGDLITSRIVTGILECDPVTKQELGQRLARHLGLREGRAGPDGGIDGIAVVGDRRVLFQCKLERRPIGVDDAKIFWADLVRHGMTAGIYLAGQGYTEEFRSVIQKLVTILQDWGHPVEYCLLTLEDIFEKTPSMHRAVRLLPPLATLDQAMKAEPPAP
jgi:hypothetical protein